MSAPASPPAPFVAMILRLVRSGGAGLLATAADVGTLTLLTSGFGVDPRVANVPALLAGGVTMFFGQRHFGFRAGGGGAAHARRQVVAFTATQVLGLAMNAYLFDLGVRFVPHAREHIVVLRLVVSNLVWLGYSFPVWHWVFRAPPAGAPVASE